MSRIRGKAPRDRVFEMPFLLNSSLLLNPCVGASVVELFTCSHQLNDSWRARGEPCRLWNYRLRKTATKGFLYGFERKTPFIADFRSPLSTNIFSD